MHQQLGKAPSLGMRDAILPKEGRGVARRLEMAPERIERLDWLREMAAHAGWEASFLVNAVLRETGSFQMLPLIFNPSARGDA